MIIWLLYIRIHIVIHPVSMTLITIAKYRKKGYDEYDSQICALNEMIPKFDISFREVL